MKQVIVTGAAAGIGLATARRLRSGRHAWLPGCEGRRGEPGGNFQEGRRDSAARRSRRRWRASSGVDVLVNNAGILRDGLLVKYKRVRSSAP